MSDGLSIRPYQLPNNKTADLVQGLKTINMNKEKLSNFDDLKKVVNLMNKVCSYYNQCNVFP